MFYPMLVVLAQKVPVSALVAFAGLTTDFSKVRSFAHDG